jgi:hypothetical protein
MKDSRDEPFLYVRGAAGEGHDARFLGGVDDLGKRKALGDEHRGDLLRDEIPIEVGLVRERKEVSRGGSERSSPTGDRR